MTPAKECIEVHMPSLLCCRLRKEQDTGGRPRGRPSCIRGQSAWTTQRSRSS
nr:MAG TPA: hypothetical protein [Caudoviricetes sp.]